MKRELTHAIVEKERKKAEKVKKFAEKQAKTASNSTATKVKGNTAKQENLKEVPLAEYVEETSPGEKKSMSNGLPIGVEQDTSRS